MIQPAIYARYSSDAQRSASIADQVRNCRAYSHRAGWPDPIVYSDAAVSAQRADRPGYQQMISGAQGGAFNVLLVDDLSRLHRVDWRTGQVLEQLQYLGVRVVGISDGIDSDQRGFRLQAGVRGVLNAVYLDDLREKTRRGLEGVFLQGNSAGGLAYGYTSQPVSDDGRVVGFRKRIKLDEAQWVEWIYQQYAAGESPRAIAYALNDMKVPAPRSKGWAHTAIYPDLRRQVGILANPLYGGLYLWNRSRWIKNPVTGRRERVERPREEWLSREVPELRIVSKHAWEGVQVRLNKARAVAKQRQQQGRPNRNGGPRPRYLLTGLLKCGNCNASYVAVGKDYLGCAGNKDRGASFCANTLHVRRPVIEKAVLAQLKDNLLSQESLDTLSRHLLRFAESDKPDLAGIQERIDIAKDEIANLVNAIKTGIVTPSTKSALEAAEEALSRATAELVAAQKHQPRSVVPDLRKTWKAYLERLSDPARVASARKAVKDLLGEIPLNPRDNNYLEAEMNQGRAMATLSSLTMVAGAGFEPTTFGL